MPHIVESFTKHYDKARQANPLGLDKKASFKIRFKRVRKL